MLMKRVLSIILTTGILMSTLPGYAFNNEVTADTSTVITEEDVDAVAVPSPETEAVAEGEIPEEMRLEATSGVISGCGLSWSLSPSGMLMILGNGSMNDFVQGDTPWSQQKQYIRFIYIADGITNIGAYAFSELSNLRSVYMPNSVESIGVGAFEGCTFLKELALPNSLKSIGDNAFKDCYSIKTIRIPANVVSIGISVFSNCKSLTSINVSSGNTAFVSKDGVLFTAGFSTLIAYPENKKGENYVIPKGVAAIGEYAFDDCDALTNVELPKTLFSIGSGAFHECSGIKKIEIPASVTEIAQDAILYGMDSLEKIQVDKENQVYADVNGVLFDKDLTTLLRFPAACKDACVDIGDGPSYELPLTVTTIGQEAFWDCHTIDTLYIYGSLEKIEMAAFMYFDSLKEIYFDGTSFNWEMVEKGIFNEKLNEVPINFLVGELEKQFHAKVGVTYYLEDFVDLQGNDVLLETLVVSSSNPTVATVDKTKMTAISEGEAIITAVVFKDGATYAASVQVIVTKSDNDNQSGTFPLIQGETMDLRGALSVPQEFMDALVWTSSNPKIAVVENGVVTAVERGKAVIIASVNSEDSLAYSVRCEIVVEPKYTSEEYFKFNKETGTITKYIGPDAEVIIPLTIGGIPVKAIGDSAFYNCNYITKVEVPETVTKIDRYAFYGCSSLANISLHEGIQYIGDYAFTCCSSLIKMTIPSTVTNNGRYWFNSCNKLDTITFAEGIKKIPSGVGFSPVKKIVLPSSATEISDSAFYYCNNLEEINIPNGVETLGSSAFSGCTKLKKVKLGSRIKAIGYQAFYNCSSLKTIEIPSSVTAIGNYAFEGCTALEQVSLAEGLKTIGYGAFYCCSSLKSIRIPNSVTQIGDYAFYSCGMLNNINFGSGLQSIGSSAFYYCSMLKEIKLPDSMKTIGSDSFRYCRSLSKVDLGNGLQSIGNGAFSNCSTLESVKISGRIPHLGNAFSDCSRLKQVVLGEGITTIGNNAFSRCTSLESIVIPNSVNKIGNSAFLGCNQLKTVSLGTGLKTIEELAFSQCSSLKSITIPSGVTEIQDYTFRYCSSLKNVNLGSSIRRIGQYAFDYCASLEQITIPDSVKSINAYAFEGCSKLENIDLGSGITKIGQSAFYNCTSLKSITIPDSVTQIERYAFQQCRGLEQLTLGNGLQYIDQGAFYFCNSLESVTIPNSVISLGDYAFYKCSNLDELDLGTNVRIIGRYAFAYCTSLENLMIPDSVNHVKDYGFAYCTNLSDVQIGNPLCVFGYNVFYRCDKLNSSTEWTASYKVLSEDTVGYFPMQIEYEVEGSLITDKKITVNLPENTYLVPGSMKLDGELYNNYTEAEAKDKWTRYYNEIVIELEKNSGVLTFCIKPMQYGSFSTSATMSMSQLGRTVTKQIGQVHLAMPDVTINAASTTGKPSVVVEGSAIPYTDVKLSIDGNYQKTVRSTMSGKYKTTVEINEPENYREYKITAEVIGNGGAVSTADAIVQYVANTPNLESLTYYYGRIGSSKKNYTLYSANGGVNRPVVQWGNPGAVRNHGKGYEYYFEVNLSQRENVDKVYVVSFKDNKKEYLEAVWDSRRNRYVTSGYFANDWNYMPGVLTVEYTKKAEAASANLSDFDAYFDFESDAFAPSITDYTSTSFSAEVAVADALRELFGSSIALNVETVERDYTGVSVEALCLDESNYYAYPLKRGGNQSVISFDLRSIDGASVVIHDMTGGKEITYQISFVSADADGGETPLSVLEILNRTEEYAGRISNAYNLNFNIEEINEGLQLAGISPETIEVGNEKAEMMELKKQMFILMATVLSASSVEELSAPSQILEYILALIEEDVEYFRDLRLLNIYRIGLECKVKWVLDPSGYVYEGVTDNRLEGVTATIFYVELEEMPIKADGSPDAESLDPSLVKLWEASEYNDQKNPLLTDANGMYAWDVPTGYWQVKYEKEGYEPTYSDWLPVPPPQTDVNVELVSTAAPKVESASLTTGALTVVFDKYMKPESITNVSVGDASYTLEYDKTKKDLEGNILAKEFKFKFQAPLSGGVEHTVNISEAKSYADIPMEDYSAGLVAEGKATYRFVDEDGTVLKEATVDCGTAVEAPTENPEKASTTQFTYTFAGWSGYTDGMMLTGDITFTAEYTPKVRQYTYRFVDEDGRELKKETVDYGTVIVAPDKNPEKASTAEHSYTFADWKGYSAGMLVTEDVTFTAEYTERASRYTYRFVNDDGTVIKEATVDYGTTIVAPEEIPQKEATAEYTYTFAEWVGFTPGMTITGDITFTAEYTESVNQVIPEELVLSNVTVNGNTISVEHTNNLTGNASFDVICAVYNDKNVLIGIQMRSVTDLESGMSNEEVFTFDTSWNSYKIFTWSSFEKLLPWLTPRKR